MPSGIRPVARYIRAKSPSAFAGCARNASAPCWVGMPATSTLSLTKVGTPANQPPRGSTRLRPRPVVRRVRHRAERGVDLLGAGDGRLDDLGHRDRRRRGGPRPARSRRGRSGRRRRRRRARGSWPGSLRTGAVLGRGESAGAPTRGGAAWRHEQQRLLGRRGRGDVRRPARPFMFEPEVLDPAVDFLAGPRRRRAGPRAGHRHRPGRDPAGRPRRPGLRHRAVAADDRRAPPQAGRHPGRRGRHGDGAGRGRVQPRLRRVEQHRQHAHPGRAGGVLPQRGATPRAGRSLRHRALGAGDPAVAAGAGGGAVPRRAAPRRVRHLRHGDPAGHVPPLPPARRRHGHLRREQLPLHLAGRVRPDGTARRDGARATGRGLARGAVHHTTARATSPSGAGPADLRPRSRGGDSPRGGRRRGRWPPSGRTSWWARRGRTRPS